MKEKYNFKALIRNCDPKDYFSIAEKLDSSDFDEKIEINLKDKTYRMLTHTDNKFMGNMLQGDFNRLYNFAIESFVHPDDAKSYKEIADPDTLKERLAAEDKKGVISGVFRIKGTDDNWIDTHQFFISGKIFGLDEDTVICYVFDLKKENVAKTFLGETVIREEITGLLDGMNFYRPAQKFLNTLETDGSWCVININIVHHKLFSDWYGLDEGQYLLTRVAEVLKRTAADNNGMPGYMGQEEFVLIIPYDEDTINNLQNDLLKIISSVSRIEGFIPALGIAIIDGSCVDIREYFNRAALTVEEIKHDLNHHIKVYNAELHKQNSEEYRLLNEFEDAINGGLIDFWLQPQCRVPDYKIVGAEALARWHRKDGSFVSPAVFVPVLEKYSIVIKLDVFIWEEVCKWLRKWIDDGHTPVPISINVSRIDIFSIDVPEYLSGLVKKYDLNINNIKVEITESAYAQDANVVGETIQKLREFGFLVLMDDFGSGYSSLNMLRSVSVDVIKLDAQFLKIGNTEEQKGVSILESILNMTRNLATPIIVEGVETDAQLKFLSDLGCSYMQGYYFHKPMPLEDFEELICDENNIDTHGFIFKANQQLNIREFMDENIYSDTMLNNIIGPVVFYNWNGKDVDIIRYNQQFFQMVGIDVSEFIKRKIHIQDAMYPGDDQKLYKLLQEAVDNHTIGSKGVVRAYRPDGTVSSLSLQIYFVGENDQGKQFYVSAHDVSELQYINTDFPGGYYRCTTDDTYEFLYISRSFQSLTGFNEEEIQKMFNNLYINMVHPDDRELLQKQAKDYIRNKKGNITPYRIIRKNGDYIYVAEQNRLSDNFGIPCWQSTIIDITDVMHIRNQMAILSDYLTDSILFLHRKNNVLEYEVAVHGLKNTLGMEAKQFEEALNNGDFCKMIEGYRDDIPHHQYTEIFINSISGSSKGLKVTLPDGRKLNLAARADRVKDRGSIEYIVILHAVTQASD